MDDMHKPLGNAKKAPSQRQWALPIVLGLATAVLSLTAYLVIDARKSSRTRVAVVDDLSASVKPATKTASPTQGTLDHPIETEPDTNQVKPLSPLDPIEPAVPEGKVKPAFKPVKLPQKRPSDWMPMPDLVEKSEFGSLPRISDGNIRPLDAYSQSNGVTGSNRIALIVGGLGLSQTGTQAAIKTLPSSISLGFSPFGNSLQRWMQNARREGHEVVLQLPMEPLGYPSIDPGPRTLTSVAEEGHNLMNLRWSLGRMTNYPVVMNYLGAGLTGKPGPLRPLLQEIRDRGLGYIDDGSASASVAIKLAREMRLPNASGNIVIDAVRDADRMRANLQALESLAKVRGYAIGTASAFPETVKIITEWAKQARSRDITIVPVSNLLKDYPR
jgi:polysaccharide deacetylase 2 family uncharacterized protein YibQ